MKGKDIAQKISEKLVDEISQLSIQDLKNLINACKKFNRVNCWWITYDLRNLIEELAENELRIKINREFDAYKQKLSAVEEN